MHVRVHAALCTATRCKNWCRPSVTRRLSIKLAVAGVEDDLERFGRRVRLQGVTQLCDGRFVGLRTVHHGADCRTTEKISCRPACQLREPAAAVDDRMITQANVRQQKTLI